MDETPNDFMEKLSQFWGLVVEVWQTGFLGFDIGRVLVAFGIVLIFLLLRRFITFFILKKLHTWAEKTTTRLDKTIITALEDPIRFVPVVMGVFFALEYLDPSGSLGLTAARLVRSLIAMTLFWGFFNLVVPISHLMNRLKRVLTAAMVEWMVKAIRVAILFVGAATILEIWGIQVAPILAGLGLLGVAVALGAQDLFKNLIAGLLILVEKRFNIGDWILVDGVVEGTVEIIGFRSTMVRRFDRAPVYVPNARLADNAVTNFSSMTHRRIYWHIGVQYGTTIEQLREIRDQLEAYIHDSPDFASPNEVSTFVRIDRFSDSSIDIMLYCFTRTIVWGEWLEIKERLALHIKQVVEGAGTSFAFPSRSLYFGKTPGDSAEVFVPPSPKLPRK